LNAHAIQGGAIIAVSPFSALVGGEYRTHYTPTSAGVYSLIRSSAIAPGEHGFAALAAAETMMTEIDKHDLADTARREYWEEPRVAGASGSARG
jgi:L-rhamnose 1-dehydrogenase